ncbi:hypothetical protein IAR55_005553 [Kwoniella newhampshirensis]|uniref:ATP-dependent RNA helicase n=1 Tax=Kwoniella newhampshirensis TaxID=1651941 RepID=A0AAW0YWK0_9TREE
MLLPRSSSRLSNIALTTPPLRHILLRALHPSPASSAPNSTSGSRSKSGAGGSRRSNDRTDRSSRGDVGGFGRSTFRRDEGSSAKYGESRSGLGFDSGSGGTRSSFGDKKRKPGFGMMRDAISNGGGDSPRRSIEHREASSRPRAQDRPYRDTSRYDSRTGGPGLAQIDKGRPAPTSSRRLASLGSSPSPRAPHSKTPSSSYTDSRDTESHRPTAPRFPKSQPFQPPTYYSTPTLADPSQAQPRSFESFPLQSGLIESLKARFGPDGVTTPIQTLSFDRLTKVSPRSDGTKAILGAETGSGKTFAYLIPLFHQLKETDPGQDSLDTHDALYPRSIILSPTHELTRQSTRFAKSLTHNTKLSVVGLSDTAAGGVGDRRGLTDVLLGTVGSVRRMLGIKRPGAEEEENEKEDIGAGLWKPEEKKGVVRGDKMEWVVIDEADVLLGGDFSEETLSVLTKLAPRNLILCTATLPPSLLNLLNSHSFFTSPKSPTTAVAPSLSSDLDSPSTEKFEKTLPGFIHLLSPGLHKLPPKLETRFVPPSRTGNRFADVAHEIRRVFSDDAIKRKALLKAQAASSGGEGSTTESIDVSEGKSKIVIFVNSDKKVEQLSGVLGFKGLDCLAWTGDGEERLRGRNGALDDFLLPAGAPPRSIVEPTASPAPWAEEHDQVDPITPSGSVPPHPDTNESSSSSSDDRSRKDKDRRRILVTTSLLSRGLDFHPSVSSIFLLDPPRDVLDFVHRAGRAGRAGREGRVVVFGLGDGSGVGQRVKKVTSGATAASTSRGRGGGGGASASASGGQGGLGKELSQVIGKREIRRNMAGGRIRKPRI